MIISYSVQWPTGLTTCGALPSAASAAARPEPASTRTPIPERAVPRRFISGPHDDGGVHLPVEGIADDVFAGPLQGDRQRLAGFVGPAVLLRRTEIEGPVAAL